MNYQTVAQQAQELAEQEDAHVVWALRQTLNGMSNEELCEVASEWADDERIESQIRNVDKPKRGRRFSGRHSLICSLETSIKNRM